ncbi:MAG: esterase family protein [Anaerolineae bacterium]|nr:esterase family protein [Anaerolineae bacterium]
MSTSHPLLERAQREGTPLIDGDQATFVWHGPAPAPLLVGDFNYWGAGREPIALERVGEDVWAHTASFERDAYLEYAYLVTRDSEERLPDPFNPRTVWNGIKAYNHYFSMLEAQTDVPEAQRPRGIARGKVTRLLLDSVEASWSLVGGKRYVRLYQPPVDEPVPLLIVLDGSDFYKRASIVPIVDTLIASQRIRPIALALIDNSPAGRLLEYATNDATLALLHDVVVPFVGQRIPLLDEKVTPGIHGVAGASLGGLMSLYAGLRIPHIFGHIISHSGAFAVDPERRFVVVDLAAHAPLPPLKLWLDCGIYEPLIAANRQMSALLRARGYDFHYQEYHGGHNYSAWRRMLPRALETVYGV